MWGQIGILVTGKPGCAWVSVLAGAWVVISGGGDVDDVVGVVIIDLVPLYL